MSLMGGRVMQGEKKGRKVKDRKRGERRVVWQGVGLKGDLGLLSK